MGDGGGGDLLIESSLFSSFFRNIKFLLLSTASLFQMLFYF